MNTQSPRTVRRLGHDFGSTAFGVAQVAARRELACCGDPADCQERCATVVSLCICDPEFLELDCADLRCPSHGLAAVLRSALEGAREA